MTRETLESPASPHYPDSVLFITIVSYLHHLVTVLDIQASMVPLRTSYSVISGNTAVRNGSSHEMLKLLREYLDSRRIYGWKLRNIPSETSGSGAHKLIGDYTDYE